MRPHSPAVLSLPMSGGQVETEVTLETCALVLALAPFALVASGLSLVMGIMVTSLLCCWEITTGPAMREPSRVPVSAYGRPLVLLLLEKQ